MTENNNESPINGQGIRIIQQSEGINVPLLNPWEVEGEKEELKKLNINLNLVLEVDAVFKSLYTHKTECQDPLCEVSKFFDSMMRIRRNLMFPLLVSKELEIYSILSVILSILIKLKGDRKKFLTLVGDILINIYNFSK
jgi:hypothetical protein